MTSSASEPLRISLSHQQQPKNQSPKHNDSPDCRLQWRRGQLLVRLSQFNVKQPNLPALESQQGLVECLKNSPVRLVCIDSKLGETTLQRWADACFQAKKPVFLRGALAPQKMPSMQSQLSWCLSWIAALLLLVVLSPIMLTIVALTYVYSPGAIFSRHWCVAARGKLFRGFKFCTTKFNNSAQGTPVGRWMCKYGLDELPKLFNVLRGEISLVGPHFLTLHDAVLLSSSATQVEQVVSLSTSGGTNKFRKNLQLVFPFLTDQAY